MLTNAENSPTAPGPLRTAIGTVAALIALSAAPAQASPVLSPLTNVTLTGPQALDIDGDGTDDFMYGVGNPSEFLTAVVSGNLAYQPYALSDPIAFSPADFLDAITLASHPDYVGLYFYRSASSAHHLGWLQFNWDGDPIVVGAGWEETPETSILAGAPLSSTVPEPATAGPIAALLSWLGFRRYRAARRSR